MSKDIYNILTNCFGLTNGKIEYFPFLEQVSKSKIYAHTFKQGIIELHVNDVLCPLFEMDSLLSQITSRKVPDEFRFETYGSHKPYSAHLRNGYLYFPTLKAGICFDVVRTYDSVPRLTYDVPTGTYVYMTRPKHKRRIDVASPSYARIIQVLHMGPKTAQEIAGILGIGINSVSGRLTELRDCGYVEIAGKKKYPGRKENYLWRVPFE